MTHAKTELLKVLHDTRDLLALPHNDFVWSSWDSSIEALTEFDQIVVNLDSHRYSDFSQLSSLFAPTGSIQEVSISSGWGKEFLGIAERFDTALEDYRRAIRS
jgi:hypothetical protein